MDRQDFNRQKTRQNNLTRTIYDLGMGLLWTAVGIFLLLHEKFGVTLNFDNLLANIFGGVCIFYGLFRVYRGYKSYKQR
jgi:hypothetical protein